MKKSIQSSKVILPCSIFSTPIKSKASRRDAFTLIEVILVLVLLAILSGITLPYFAGSFKNSKLRSTARAMGRMTRYARSMAIMRETTMTVVLDHKKMLLYVGGEAQTTNQTADGELDQDVLKALGYVDDGGQNNGTVANLEQEAHFYLPDGLSVKSFDKDWTEEDQLYEERNYLMRFFANGQCEWFKMRVENNKGTGVLMEIDPISGKIHSEFTQ